MSKFEQRGDGMHTYLCDGMPTLMGCGAEIEVSRQYTRSSWSSKPSGWLVIYADDETDQTPDNLLHFCPSCALVVKGQRKSARGNR